MRSAPIASHDPAGFFREAFGHEPACVVRAPGRLELLGNHTDYNDGLVMAVTIDRHVLAAASPRTDARVEIVSSAFPGRESFPLDRIAKNPAVPWTDYSKGVLLQLQEAGVRPGGFNLAFDASLEPGSGMSSSAALEVATALAVRALFPFSLSGSGRAIMAGPEAAGRLPPLDSAGKMALAQRCQAAEVTFVGANVGLLDQISSLFGRADHVIHLDCRDLTVDYDPMPAGVAVVVCNSGVRHDLAAGQYNELRRHCESAARTLGVHALRSVGPDQLEAARPRLAPRDYECARHIVGENHRVTVGARALREGDVTRFGQLLFESHRSSRDSFRNSCPELDLLVDLSRRLPGCLGSRLTGGGFGGSTIHLVRLPDAAAFADAMADAYQARTGRSLRPLLCRIVDGAG